MKKIIMAFLLLANMQSFAFDTWWHAECTRKAMTENGFSSDARLATQVSNYLTDFISVVNMPNDFIDEYKIKNLRFRSNHSYDFMHFDAIYNIKDIQYNWGKIYENTKNALRKYSGGNKVEPGFKQIVLFNIIGASLHIIQDFYSHSNWVNTFVNKKIHPIPTWYEIDSIERSKIFLYTGAYPDWSSKNNTNHKDLNKDCSTQELNTLAVQAAEKASIEWIKKLMNDVPEIDWAGLKTYTVENNMVMKNYLRKLDATFLTSSSIVASKLDGAAPVRKIFDENLVKEKAKAASVLSLTFNAYSNYVIVKENPYRLPTPYWAGFYQYFITYDLASGLMFNNELYKIKK
jgi:hypothetical protein